MCLQGMLFLRRNARSHSFSTFPPFFLLDSWLFPVCLALLSHPACLIQLIFSQSKYESTKNQFIMLQNQVRSSFCDFVTVVYIRRLHCGSPVLNCSLLLSSFFPERMFLIFAMSGLWHPPHVCMCLCRYPACVCAFLYTGTTCYSQGWSSLRPVSLCVYSSGGLLPPDYKKDWWINNILLSLALSLTLSEALKLVCACVCVCVYVLLCMCVLICQ